MRGVYNVYVETPDSYFELELARQFVEVIGMSGTSKSLLRYAIEQSRQPLYNVNSDRGTRVQVFTDDLLVQDLVPKTIYIIDEDVCEILFFGSDSKELSHKFMERAKYSDCYFLLLCRRIPKSIPCSILCLCEFVSISVGDKNVIKLVQAYHWKRESVTKAEYLLTEDFGLGFRFYVNTLRKYGVIVESSNGNRGIIKSIFRMIDKYSCNRIFIVADGAVFAYVYTQLLDLKQSLSELDVDLRLFLHESFEYLILASGVVSCDKDYISNAVNHVDSTKHISWEEYFTKKLSEVTHARYAKNSKGLEELLMLDENIEKMFNMIEEIQLN